MNSQAPELLMDTDFWPALIAEAEMAAAAEPVLASFYHQQLIRHSNFAEALACRLAAMLADAAMPATALQALFCEVLRGDSSLSPAMIRDARAYVERDPACDQLLMPVLYFKGYQALQVHRIAHSLYQSQRLSLALYLQSRISQVFAVDIHPAAKIGSGIMIDHATGVVIGETAVIGDDVSLLHAVTLGGTGCSGGDRHPKVGSGVLIGAGAKILGNIAIGCGAKVAAGSVVLEPVPKHTTVAGVPAKIVGAFVLIKFYAILD